MNKNKLLIIGASGHGKVIADIALKMNQWDEIAFLDDDENIKTSLGLKVIGTLKDVYKYLSDYDIFVGIGDNTVRKKIQEKLEKQNASIPVLIHPSVVQGMDVEFGDGTVVMAKVVINCCTQVGKGCIVNTGSIIDHDNKIDDFVHISPGASIAGTVKVGKCSWLGIGSVISNNITIATECNIGAGAVVINDINESGTYVGVPARRNKI